MTNRWLIQATRVSTRWARKKKQEALEDVDAVIGAFEDKERVLLGRTDKQHAQPSSTTRNEED